MILNQAPSTGKAHWAEDTTVCVCRQVTEATIRRAIEKDGLHSLAALKAVTGAATRCTGCEVHLYEILDDYSGSLASSGVSSAAKSRIRAAASWARFHARRILKPWTRTAVWVASNDTLRTRIILSNIPFPEDGSKADRPVRYRVKLHDSSGARIGTTFTSLLSARETLGLELESVLPPHRVGNFHGLAFVDFFGLDRLGSLRPYCHWYWKEGFTTTHDKYGWRPIQEGYHTLTTVRWDDAEDTHVVLANPTQSRFTSTVHLVDHETGADMTGTLDLLPFASFFGTPRSLVQGASTRGRATMWIENTQALVAYYFGHYRDGIWVAQHW